MEATDIVVGPLVALVRCPPVHQDCRELIKRESEGFREGDDKGKTRVSSFLMSLWIREVRGLSRGGPDSPMLKHFSTPFLLKIARLACGRYHKTSASSCLNKLAISSHIRSGISFVADPRDQTYRYRA